MQCEKEEKENILLQKKVKMKYPLGTAQIILHEKDVWFVVENPDIADKDVMIS